MHQGYIEPQVALVIPGYLKYATVAFYVQALVPHAMPNDGAMSLLQNIFRETPSLFVALLGLGVIWAVFLALATRIVERREYVLEQ